MSLDGVMGFVVQNEILGHLNQVKCVLLAFFKFYYTLPINLHESFISSISKSKKLTLLIFCVPIVFEKTYFVQKNLDLPRHSQINAKSPKDLLSSVVSLVTLRASWNEKLWHFRLMMEDFFKALSVFSDYSQPITYHMIFVDFCIQIGIQEKRKLSLTRLFEWVLSSMPRHT